MFCRYDNTISLCQLSFNCDAGFELADRESRIAAHFKIFVDQFCLFVKFSVQNTSVVQIRD